MEILNKNKGVLISEWKRRSDRYCELNIENFGLFFLTSEGIEIPAYQITSLPKLKLLREIKTAE